jgi:Zn-dependent metalloprotease
MAAIQERSGLQCNGIIPDFFIQQLRNIDPHSRRWQQCSFNSESAIAKTIPVALRIEASIQEAAQGAAATPSPVHRDFIIIDQDQREVADSQKCLSIDPIVTTARRNIDLTLRFLRNEFKRNSIDGQGSTVKVYINWTSDACPATGIRRSPDEKPYANARWCGNNSVVFGTGEKPYFGNFVTDIDTVGHEVGHGIVEHTAKLVYSGQSGALDESFCDVFGSMLKQYSFHHMPREADWLIGDNIVLDLQQKQMALRSMKVPGDAYQFDEKNKDRQVGHIQYYQDLPLGDDFGGVHIFSGIPNKAFYTFSTGLNHYSWEVAGQVWVRALYISKSTTNFLDFAAHTCKSVDQIYQGQEQDHSIVQNNLVRGWDAVGIDVRKCFSSRTGQSNCTPS